jgi:flavin-dependent dehydrogenase
MMERTDVFIIGGGPAGLAAAIATRQRGFDVVVADGAEPPIDKACGEGLLPDAVQVLARLGIEIPASERFTLRGIRFLDADLKVDAEFSAGQGMGVRRAVLHQRMVERAREVGVTLLWKTPVSGISSTGVITDRKTIAARWIIGADGIRSRVRRWAGLEPPHQHPRRFAFRRHYGVQPWCNCTEFYWGRSGQAYVTPVGPHDICVALISRDPQARLASIDSEFPQLAERLASAAPTSAERGAVTLSRSLDRVYRGRIALIGDASGSVDAITGEGLSLGFCQGLALADALEAGDLRGYQAAHRRLTRRPALMERLLLLLDRQPNLRNRAMRAFTAHPELFARLVAVHVGDTSPGHLASTGALLGWRFVTA